MTLGPVVIMSPKIDIVTGIVPLPYASNPSAPNICCITPNESVKRLQVLLSFSHLSPFLVPSSGSLAEIPPSGEVNLPV